MEGGALTERHHAGLGGSYSMDTEFQATPKINPGQESSRRVLDLAALRIMLGNLEESETSDGRPEEEEAGMDVIASLRIVLDKLRESMSHLPSPNTTPEELPTASQSLPEIKYDERRRKLKLVSRKDINRFKARRQRPPVRPVDHGLIDRVKNDKLRENARRSLVAAYEARLRMRATEEDIMRQYDIHGYAYFEVPEKLIDGSSVN